MVLTERQREELHACILDYCTGAGFVGAADAFRREAFGSGDGTAVEPGTLERRWTALLRQQRRISELEAQVADLQTTARSADKRSRGVDVIAPDFVPRAVRATLLGHRKAVSCIAVHPVYSVAASGSEDAAIRVWETETATCERTLTGHTGAVSDIAFDGPGALLASASSDTTVKLWDFGWASGAWRSIGGSLLMGRAGSSAAAEDALGGGHEIGGSSSAAATYACVRTLRGHDGAVSGVCFVSGAAARLLSCARDSEIFVWDTESGVSLRRLSGGHGGEWVRRVATNVAGTLVASCGNDKARCVPHAGRSRGAPKGERGGQWPHRPPC